MKRSGGEQREDYYSKRSKGEVQESKVIHVKGIPSDCTETELFSLVSAHGTPIRSLIVGPKRQAFVELDSIASATKLLTHYSSATAFLRGTPVFFEFSSRAEIAPNPRYPSGEGGTMDTKFKDVASSPIILVTVLNCRLPVTIENLYQVFRTCGDVLRIVTFQKKTFQALIEYPNIKEAALAKRSLEGKDIFQGCCTLQISFSNLSPPLKVKSDGMRARDFTVGIPTLSSLSGGYSPPHYSGYASPATEGYAYQPPQSYPGFSQEGCVLLVVGLAEDKVTPDMLFTLFGVYGDVIRVKILYNKKDTALVQFATPAQATTARTHLDQAVLFDKKLSVVASKNKDIAPPRPNSKSPSTLTKDYTGSALHRYKRPGSRNERHICPPSPTLYVSNLPDDVNGDDLKAFFSQDDHKVLSVRLFGDKKKMAFVNFSSVNEAISALIRFHNATVGERHIKITFSHAKE